MTEQQAARTHFDMLKQYSAVAMSFARYPNIGKNIDYPLVGGTEELGELFGKLHTAAEADDTLNDIEREQLCLEAGDVFWYFNAFMSEAGIPLERFAALENDCTVPTMTKDSAYHIGAVEHQATRLMACLGGVCGQIKRLHRDDGDEMTPERREKIFAAGQLFVQQFANVCATADLTFEQVLDANVQKLSGRRERGTLHGSGDNR
jgi:hypothetical protein